MAEYWTKTTRTMLAAVKEVGAMPFILFEYYLTWQGAADGIKPTLQKTAEDLGLETNAVCNLRSRLIKAGWIRYENGEIFIAKSFTKNESDSQKMNGLPENDSQIVNKSSQKMNQPFTKNESPYKEERDKKKKDKKEKNIPNGISAKAEKPKKTKSDKFAKDTRSQHVAIQTIRGLMKRYPDQILWDKIIKRFGEHFNKDKLAECRIAWVERGYNPIAVTWLNWYFDGIPERNGVSNGTDKQLNGKYPKRRTDEDVFQESADFYADWQARETGNHSA